MRRSASCARWAPYVRSEGGFDRKFYELSVMAELKNALRAGDVWVPGSRQFRDFDEYLIERAAFTAQAETAATGLAVATDAGSYLEERLATLHRELTLTNRLARQGQLPAPRGRSLDGLLAPLHSPEIGGAGARPAAAAHGDPRRRHQSRSQENVGGVPGHKLCETVLALKLPCARRDLRPSPRRAHQLPTPAAVGRTLGRRDNVFLRRPALSRRRPRRGDGSPQRSIWR